MKFVQIITSCDMTRATTSPAQHVPAEETVYIAIGSDPDRMKVCELDVTADWAKQLREIMQPFLDAGHDPGEMGGPAATVTGRPRPGARDFNAARVAWAKAHGYSLTPRSKGGYYVPRKTEKAYAQHLAGCDDLLTEANGLQPDYDPVTGNSV